MDYEGKRLLVLAGAGVHVKLIKTAQEMGIYTIVSDNVPNSYAKKISDKAYDINIFDIDSLAELCTQEHIDGIVSCYIDPCQRPYNELCERMGYYCYGTQKQFFLLTDKHAFKKMCMDNGVDVIPEYSENELDSIQYPVFVKPVDSRGSRGQSVCYTKKELLRAITFAKDESSNGDILIEKYMKGANEFQITYFFKDGEAYLLRTVDSYCGSEEKHLEKVVSCAVSPSRFTELYMKTAHEKVVKMFKNIGLKNGPVFMQGFEDNGVFRFFDPGLRFPGVDYDLIYKRVFNIDIMKAMINIALFGTCGDIILPEDSVLIKGKRAAVLFPTIKAGVINKKEGEEDLLRLDEVVSYLPRWNTGANVQWTYNVNQRSAEIDLLCNNTESLKQTIDYVQTVFKCIEKDGKDMTYELFDVTRIV